MNLYKVTALFEEICVPTIKYKSGPAQLFNPTLVKQSSDIVVDKTVKLVIWLKVL
jgi:hypothetical protein